MGAPAKFAACAAGNDAAELSVATLREHLDKLVMFLDRGWFHSGKPLKPMQRRKLEHQRDAVATCIELLTDHGNYSREIHESLVRLRPISTRIEDLTK